KKVFIRCESTNPYRIHVAVRDEGTGFDYSSLPDPTAPENLINPGGRGVFLMTHLSDEITFGDEGRKVEMVFNI
ncbi:MAG: ATP-binding protein, partial [Bacteroidota bacterium]